MNEEMLDGLCMCYTGRISRLVNCLNGFYDDVIVRIGSNEQIGNIVIITKQELERSDSGYTIEKHRNLVRVRLVDLDYDTDTIEEWLSFIDE